MSALPSLSKSKSTTLAGCGGGAGAADAVGIANPRIDEIAPYAVSNLDGIFAMPRPAGTSGPFAMSAALDRKVVMLDMIAGV
jgi:hypothetical protein